jgi:hypothetical protein
MQLKPSNKLSQIALLLALTLPAQPAAAQQNTPLRVTFDLTWQGRRLEGMPLAWSEDRVFLLSRDGALYDFAPDEAQEFRQTARDFRSYPASVMKSRLEAELGKKFEVTWTGHFLVATARGKQRQWSERFEEMYRSFLTYFKVRGFQLSEPEFPLIAVIWENQEDFQRFAAREGWNVTKDTLGFYLPSTNRVSLYDVDGGQSTRNWQLNMATVVHEAAHQAAFNTGIHSRWSPPPRWVAEGLGTMFEARGVWDTRTYPRREDRINAGRMVQFKAYSKSRRRPDAIQQLVQSDRFFDADAEGAYAEAWALTFFLVEQHPREYAKYLKLTAARPPFSNYDGTARLQDFVTVFGTDFRMLNARLLRFIQELP